jgi:Spy/CpxP family protein refolding chaperone
VTEDALGENTVTRLMLLAAMALLAGPQVAWAQAHQPYAGLQGRPIKAVSEQQMADLRAGRGMGLALAAELNGYPGPMHVLELAQPLGLTEGQRNKMAELFDAMKAEAITLGESLIAAEADLDRQFAGKTVTDTSLAAAVGSVAAAQGALRLAHLKYHLATVAVLSPEQIKRYADLRGYSGVASPAHHGGGRH